MIYQRMYPADFKKKMEGHKEKKRESIRKIIYDQFNVELLAGLMVADMTDKILEEIE
jgi:hypothetical protein